MPAKFVLSLDTDPTGKAGLPPPDQFKASIERFLRLLDGHGISATWTMPENPPAVSGDAGQTNLVDLLQRMKTPQDLSGYPPRRTRGIAGRVPFLTPPVYRHDALPTDRGVVDLPVSLRVSSPPLHRMAPRLVTLGRIRRGMDRAIRKDAIFHLVFDFAWLGSWDSDYRVLEDIFFHVAERRRSGHIDIATQSDIRRDYSGGHGGLHPFAAE